MEGAASIQGILSQPPERLADPHPIISGETFRHVPAGPGGAVHPGRDQRAGGVRGVRGAVGAGGGDD